MGSRELGLGALERRPKRGAGDGEAGRGPRTGQRVAAACARRPARAGAKQGDGVVRDLARRKEVRRGRGSPGR